MSCKIHRFWYIIHTINGAIIMKHTCRNSAQRSMKINSDFQTKSQKTHPSLKGRKTQDIYTLNFISPPPFFWKSPQLPFIKGKWGILFFWLSSRAESPLMVHFKLNLYKTPLSLNCILVINPHAHTGRHEA